jgi:hypothetical protein
MYLGCRIISHPFNNINLCHFDVYSQDRPSSKSGAMSDAVVGGTVVGTTGAVAATQIGNVNIFFFFFWNYIFVDR